MFLAALLGWLDREQRDVIAFLREENRVLKAQLGRRRLRLGDDQRRRLAILGERLGRGLLREFATLVTPDTILRWHREWVARKWTYARRRQGRPGVRQEILRLVVRMATDNPQWGYTRIQGALKNVGHRVARSTIASILKAEGLPPRRERSTAWTTFLRAHWPALAAADFHDRSVDRSRAGDVLHRVRHRTALAPGPRSRCHAVSRRSLRAPDHAPPDRWSGRCHEAWSILDLRSRSEMEQGSRGVPYT